MVISGIQKLTLLDYPGKTACTIFTHGCNLRCPFCHNAPLVIEGAGDTLSQEELLAFLKKRQGILEGICITGGEPTLQRGLDEFMAKVKELGYFIKLDTNGYKPSVLRELIAKGLCDYVAMDIKNSPEKYSLTTGIEINWDKISESISILKNSSIDCEFRTTVVKELHTKEDIEKIADLLKGDKPFFLQQFKNSGQLIDSSMTAYSEREMEELTEAARKILPQTGLRKS